MNNGSSFAKNSAGRRRVSAKILAIVGGVVVGLLLAEVILRVVGFRHMDIYQEDQYLGVTLKPGAEGWWRKEAKTYIKINSDGWRDREHTKVKPPDTLRIAVLGDSYSEALQVPMEMAFWAVIEQRLQGCKTFGNQKVELLNFGVSGFSTARELIALRQRVWQYSPDIIVLVVTTGNDIKENSRILDQDYVAPPLPYFIAKDGALVLDDSLLKVREAAQDKSLRSHFQKSFLGDSLNGLRNHLRLVELIDELREKFQDYRLGKKHGPRTVGDEPGIAAKVYLQAADAVWEEAWRITEGVILLMRDEVKAHGAEFMIVTGSNGIQVYPDAAVRLDFMRRLAINDLFYPDHRIKALGEREGIEVLNLAPTLQEFAEQNKTFLHGTNGFGHWNELGHRRAGEVISGKLCEISESKTATH